MKAIPSILSVTSVYSHRLFQIFKDKDGLSSRLDQLIRMCLTKQYKKSQLSIYERLLKQ